MRDAVAIQLILAKEYGWLRNENPLQGSFIAEFLTDEVEEQVLRIFEEMHSRGGVLHRSKVGWSLLNSSQSDGCPYLSCDSSLVNPAEGPL